MKMNTRIKIGNWKEATHPNALKGALAEFISVFIFVFIGEGSGMAVNKLLTTTSAAAKNSSISNKITTLDASSGLIATAIAHGFALFVANSLCGRFSGGHVNPAATFGNFVGGNISLCRGFIYWIAQLIAAVVACLLLKFTSGGQQTRPLSLSPGVSVWNALVLEIIMTFGLLYTVFATAVDPNKGSIGKIAPLAIGFIVGANILVGGAFDGGCMNPAAAFGPALVSWTWERHHWVYWVGPLTGGGLAGFVYDSIFINHS